MAKPSPSAQHGWQNSNPSNQPHSDLGVLDEEFGERGESSAPQSLLRKKERENQLSAGFGCARRKLSKFVVCLWNWISFQFVISRSSFFFLFHSGRF